MYRETVVKKPRKVHRCTGCGKKMRMDRKHYYIASTFEGEFCTARLCFGCKKHLDKYSGDYRDGWYEGDLRDGRREAVSDWKYKRLNKKAKAS